MNRPAIIVLGVVVLAALAFGVYRYRSQLGPASPTASPASSAADQPGAASHPSVEWQMIDRTSDGFKVQMPGNAGELQVPAFTANGSQEPVEMLQSSPDSDTTFAVAWANNPPVEQASEQASADGAERTLDMAREGALSRTQATLVSESRSNRDGYPARDFTGQNAGGGVLNGRLILAGSRLYMLIVTFPTANARRDEDVNRFFNSFSLTPTAQGK